MTESDARAIDTVVDWPHGELVGTWRATALLGRGGSAEVWHAVAPDGREAALKLVKPERRRHEAANELLRHEHAVLRRVASPNLVEPYELIEGDGATALALEYLPHGDLVSMLGMPPGQWLPAFRAVVGALLDLEHHGLAHGDVKARNVLFAADGSARLADVTSARPLDAPAPRTTSAYRAPAASRARARDADCHALGVLLFELLTARLPYGPGGPPDEGVEPRAVSVVGAERGTLLAAALAVLRPGGRVVGLSYFSDVIESVRAR